MRRKEREVIDEERIDAILRKAVVCRLGFYDSLKGEVYIVPMNYGYEQHDGRRVFYFHGAGEGRKMDLLKESGYV